MTAPGANNLITDIAGLSIGNAHDEKLRSGVTVLLCEQPLSAAVDMRGGGTGTRETSALEMGGLVQQIHALVLSGGSAFGLDAATGVQSYLRGKGQGFAVGDTRVPIVPQAILFDLLNGGDKAWGKRPPYQDLAFAACENAAADFALGSVGARIEPFRSLILATTGHITYKGVILGCRRRFRTRKAHPIL